MQTLTKLGFTLSAVAAAACLLTIGCKPDRSNEGSSSSSETIATQSEEESQGTGMPAGHPPITERNSASDTGAAPARPPMGMGGQQGGNAQLPPGHPPIGGQQQAQGGNDQLPPGHPPIDGMGNGQGGGMGGMPQRGNMGSMMGSPPAAEAQPMDTAPTQFEGISMTPPESWQAYDPASVGGMFAPTAIFRPSDAENTDIRLTYFPGMKNIPLEGQLDRWYGMFAQPDGKKTKDVSKMTSFEAGGATVTVVDIPGNMVQSSGPALTNYRMLAAVIEHPQGPHFLKVTGPSDEVEKAAPAVLEYLKSVKVTEGE